MKPKGINFWSLGAGGESVADSVLYHLGYVSGRTLMGQHCLTTVLAWFMVVPQSGLYFLFISINSITYQCALFSGTSFALALLMDKVP